MVVQWIGIYLPMQGTWGSRPDPGRFHTPKSN